MDRATPQANTANLRAVRRRSLFPKTILLLLAIVALVAFIALMGDARRSRNCLHQAELHAATLADRAAPTNVLPLNLDPSPPGSSDPTALDFDWIAMSEARVLRGTDERVVVAWSIPVLKFFGRDGRAVIFFHQGRFEARWLTLSEFEQAQAAQAALIERLPRVPQ